MCSLLDTNDFPVSHKHRARESDKKPSIIFGEGIRTASRPEPQATCVADQLQGEIKHSRAPGNFLFRLPHIPLQSGGK